MQHETTMQSSRIKELHRRISKIRASEEIGVKYMQEWEERAYARKEGLEEGIKAFIVDYLEEGKTETQILDKLEHRFSLTKDAAHEYLVRFSGHPDITP